MGEEEDVIYNKVYQSGEYKEERKAEDVEDEDKERVQVEEAEEKRDEKK